MLWQNCKHFYSYKTLKSLLKFKNMPVNNYFILFCETTTATTACILTACKSLTHSGEEVPASIKITVLLLRNFRTISLSQDKGKSFCALTAEPVSVNRIKTEELLGRILGSLLSLHCVLACTACQYAHNAFVLVLLSLCNPPIKLAERCQRLTYLFKLSHLVTAFQFFSS